MCALSIRKIKGKEYAYEVSREGPRLVQTYLGPADSPEVQARLGRARIREQIPASILALFWETDPSTLDSRAHALAIIRKVLELGSLSDFHWVSRRYGLNRIERVLESGRGLSRRTVGFYRLWL